MVVGQGEGVHVCWLLHVHVCDKYLKSHTDKAVFMTNIFT